VAKKQGQEVPPREIRLCWGWTTVDLLPLICFCNATAQEQAMQVAITHSLN